MKYVIAFLVLSIIIIVHELGHFIVAKASGVTVTEFSLGMGPRLLKFKRKGTMYSIKLFLLAAHARCLGKMRTTAVTVHLIPNQYGRGWQLL